MDSIMTPVLAMITWTLVMWVWMYATRIPAMQAAKIDATKMKEKSEMDVLPRAVRQIADNYNHLHEQPVIFYALAVYTQLEGVVSPFTVTVAWAYVALRVAHSLVQCTSNYIPLRFFIFAASSLMLKLLAIANIWALFN